MLLLLPLLYESNQNFYHEEHEGLEEKTSWASWASW